MFTGPIWATLNETVTNDSYHFVNWSRGGERSEQTAMLLSTLPAMCRDGQFRADPLRVSTSAFRLTRHDGGSGNFLPGERRSVVAKPYAGYLFSNWTEYGQIVSTKADYSFVVTNDAALMATSSRIISSIPLALIMGFSLPPTTWGGYFRHGRQCGSRTGRCVSGALS